jgi:type IV secretion system protein VirB11
VTAHRAYLEAFLSPFAAFLRRADVTDLYVNRPGELWVVGTAGTERHDIAGLDEASLWRLARQIAAFSDQGISREHPLLAATIPDGARIQICAPPATRGPLIMAIRKHGVPDIQLDDYQAAGAFAHVGVAQRSRTMMRRQLSDMLVVGDTLGFLRAAVHARQTMVISGGTGSGKTTFLNALLKEAGEGERLVLIEDTPEIQLRQQNMVGLVAVRGKLGEAAVTPADLVEAALRLRPDRIIMGEIRGAEAISWLRAVGIGHPGSITTVHANSPAGAVEQLAMMSMSAGTQLRREEIIDYIHSTVDVFVQLGQAEGTRIVAEIECEGL